MSPRNLHIRDEILSVVFPEAPRYTSTGNIIIVQTESYIPFFHVVFPSPIYGSVSKTARMAEQSQNAPRIFTGLKIRDINSPAEKENVSRRNPPGRL